MPAGSKYVLLPESMSLVPRIHVGILQPSVNPAKEGSDTSGLHGFLYICTHNYTAHTPTPKHTCTFLCIILKLKKRAVTSEWQELVQLSQETDWENFETS